jgi:hypothetical protein
MSDYNKSFLTENSKKLPKVGWYSKIYNESKSRFVNFNKNFNLDHIHNLVRSQMSLQNLSLNLSPVLTGHRNRSFNFVLANKVFTDQKARKFTSQLLKLLVIYVLILAPIISITDFLSEKNTKDVQPVEAMNFKSNWSSTINSISTSSYKINTSEPEFSYINPYLDYPNLSKAYQNDPEHTKKLVGRIAEYINDNRSRDSFDTSFESPVKPEYYLEVAIKYHVPIDQMLAVARSESRFGTDCYNASGSMTRICNYKNVFSIGLTESSSIGFATWEEGVESFGRLYQKRKDRGFDDCAIWRIYNPNGDYCSKILSMADKVRMQLDRE